MAEIPSDLIAPAQAAQAKWGCFASVCLAQWALESAWGKSMSGKNNPFGIKATASQPGTDKMTWEVVNGKRINVVQRFRDFASMDEAFDQHGKLLATGSAYYEARAAKTADAFANALAGHYATDPQYGTKLIAIMRVHDLYQNDVTPGRTPALATPAASPGPATPTLPSATTPKPAPPVRSPEVAAPPAAKPGFWARFWAALTNRKAA